MFGAVCGWLGASAAATMVAVMSRLTKQAEAQLRAHLGALPHEEVVELIIEQTSRDAALKDRLLIEATRTVSGPVDVASFRRSLSDAVFDFDDGGRRFPHTSGGWADDVHEAIQRLARLLDAGQPDAVIEVAEYGLGRVAKAMGEIDDSSGYFSDIVGSLEELHHRACVAARPDPVALGRRLFGIEVDAEWDILIDSVSRYADVLGDAGIAEIQTLAEQRWARVERRGPGEQDDERYGRRFRITRIMERLAEHSGDMDALVAVKGRDLSMPHDWLEIAEILAEAARHDEALSWAERGVAAFADRHDARLDEFLCLEYERHGRPGDAITLCWTRFQHRPSLATYQRLANHASRAGRWDAHRPAAIQLLRRHVNAVRNKAASVPTAGHPRFRNTAPQGAAALTEVLLWEGDTAGAWQEAQLGGVPNNLWLRLAEARETDHPLDAIPVYQREVESLIAYKKNQTYSEAVRRMEHINVLFVRARQVEHFNAYVADVRSRHRAKRNLMKLLDDKGW